MKRQRVPEADQGGSVTKVQRFLDYHYLANFEALDQFTNIALAPRGDDNTLAFFQY